MASFRPALTEAPQRNQPHWRPPGQFRAAPLPLRCRIPPVRAPGQDFHLRSQHPYPAHQGRRCAARCARPCRAALDRTATASLAGNQRSRRSATSHRKEASGLSTASAATHPIPRRRAQPLHHLIRLDLMVVRAKAILLAAEGLSNTEIAQRLGQSRQAVSSLAKTVLRGRAAGSGGETPAGQAAAFFPRGRWPRSRRWHASCRPSRAFRCRAGRALNSPGRRSKRGIVATVAAVTIWRWLREDAIRPWSYRSWIFPRDPSSPRRRVGSWICYEGRWEGQLLASIRR